MNKQPLSESLVLKTYDLLKFSIPTIERIPNKHKFTLGERLHYLLSDLLELMIEASYSYKKEQFNKLRSINILLTKIRYFFRLGYDMGCYSLGHLEHLVKRVDEIGKRVGGWIKSLSQK